MQQLENLYRQIIMDHYKNPRNKGLVDDHHYHSVHIKNPSCGDDITIQTKVEDGTVIDVRHEGSGCSICCSSASVLSDLMKNKSVSDAKTLTQTYLLMLSNQPHDIALEESLEDAMAYQGVSKFPARIKCASIAWKAFEESLEEKGEDDE